MPDYDLRGLSSRSFEQLIQALAAKVLGPGIVVFGDGPDGAREATVEGPVPFPTKENPWNGYLVIQAKFRQTPKGGASDAAWLVDQISAEFKKYSRRRRKVRPPEYYILATNIFLTATAETGGMDRSSHELRTLTHRIGTRDFRIWDGNYIRTLLDLTDDVRHAYAAWITPGDVLSALFEHLTPKSPDLEHTLAAFLQKELLTDNFVNLEQAGHSPDERTLLARVFVDLPVVKERHTSPPHMPDEKTHRIVQMIIDTGNEKLDPRSVFETSNAAELLTIHKDRLLPERGRFVIVGGPGQGKTTVGQFLVQLYRLALLKTRHPSTLSPDVRTVLSDLEIQCANEGISLPAAKRFPLRMVLSKFAAAFGSSREKDVSLLQHLASHIESRTDRPVSADEFRQWLATYPWILVLDGLDEVPASSNRDDVLKATSDFLIDIANENADIMIVATTRPQGYNNDFSPQIYEHWWLAPLSLNQALENAYMFERVVLEKEIYTGPRFAAHPEKSCLIPIQEALCDLFRKRPDWTWLLCLIAPVTLRGVRPSIGGPLDNVDLSSLCGKEKASALILRIIEGMWNDKDAAEFESRSVRDELHHLTYAFRELFEVASSDSLPLVERLLHRIYERLDQEEDALRSSIGFALNELISRRRSNLLDIAEWDSLGLAPGLRKIGLIESGAGARSTTP